MVSLDGRNHGPLFPPGHSWSPVAPSILAAYSASWTAGSKPMETDVAAWKLVKGLSIIPFLFAYIPLFSEDLSTKCSSPL